MVSSDVVPVAAVDGIRLSVSAVGLKKAKPGSDGTTLRPPSDVALIEARAGSSAAATFTQNRFEAAPVTLAREHLAKRDANKATYLLINAGNANAGTGRPGMTAAQHCCALVSGQAAVEPTNVMPFSTGVIGELLPTEGIEAAIPSLLAELSSENWAAAAEAIMTTDTVAKHGAVSCEVFGQTYTLSGISKGAGMIMPNMATMLCYMATDLSVDEALLQSLLNEAVDGSFNRITVDGDTSTNDACVLLATGLETQARLVDREQPETLVFLTALKRLSLSLATQIIEDAEGASKLVTVQVNGGRSPQDCLTVAYTIAHSPLVKTALYASDPNWGRILAAVGRAPIDQLDVEAVSIYFDSVLIAERGAVSPDYVEQEATAVMEKGAYTLRVDLGAGTASESIWTCDLSHDYVSINADYRS
ncbi:MAG: bifunctional glutamate N-acetyltransferase/amino-acid acetyltransferase ArgJ [Pseudomonadales bacterium]